MTRYEQETIINFNNEDKIATVYTSNPHWIRRMDKLAALQPEEFKAVEIQEKDGEVIAKTYKCAKDLIRIHPRRPKRTLTEEQREAAVERLRKAREARKTGEGNSPLPDK